MSDLTDYLSYYRSPFQEAESVTETPLETINPTGNIDPAHYVPHPGLVDAVNVSVTLGMPLLLTGEPGTGKTQLAASVAHQFGLASPLKFVARSTSTARDLFYIYDAIGRFYAAQVAQVDAQEKKRAKNALHFVRYSALGKAILCAHEASEIEAYIPIEERPTKGANVETPIDGWILGHSGQPQRSIVLIDEIDKAPRDFPNDLLDAIETMQFQIPELRESPTPVLGNRNLWPIIIITSNSERPLPDPFLRRCLFFDIPFPERASDAQARDGGDEIHGYFIEDIVAQRLGPDWIGIMVDEALEFFYHLRDLEPRLKKRPATAELLNWLVSMGRNSIDNATPLRRQGSVALASFSALLKHSDDQTRGRREFDSWQMNTGP